MFAKAVLGGIGKPSATTWVEFSHPPNLKENFAHGIFCHKKERCCSDALVVRKVVNFVKRSLCFEKKLKVKFLRELAVVVAAWTNDLPFRFSFLVLFSLLSSFIPFGSAYAFPISIFGNIGYESLSIGSGNANSVRPGDPAGFSLGVSGMGNFARFQQLYLFASVDMLYLSSSGTRSAGNTHVQSSLNALFVGGSSGIRIPIKCCFIVEAGAGFDYAAWSQFQYTASVAGYEPLKSEGSAEGLSRFKAFLRGFYAVKPKVEVGFELGSNFGSFSWYNSGTSELQKDSFTGVALRVAVHYWLGEPQKVAIVLGEKYQRNKYRSTLPPTWDEDTFGAEKKRAAAKKRASVTPKVDAKQSSKKSVSGAAKGASSKVKVPVKRLPAKNPRKLGSN